METLFVQIFDRKKWIVEQVQQQSDLCDQFFASNCLINGVRPPSWLLSSRFHGGSAEFKELKKQDLISGLLFPPPRPHCRQSAVVQNTLYSRLVFPENDVQDSDTLLTGTCASNKYVDVGDRTNCHQNEALSSSYQTQAMVSDTNNIQLDQSPPRIQGSKSIEKVLQVRENYTDRSGGSCRVTRSRSSILRVSSVEEGDKLPNDLDCQAPLQRYSSTHKHNHRREDIEQLPDKGDGSVPELECCYLNKAITSPDQREPRTSSTNVQVDKSLVRIQRSKSRQKALEVRNSAEVKSKKRPMEENITSSFADRLTRSRTSSGQFTHSRGLLHTFSNTMNVDSGRVTRSRSPSDQLNSVDEPLRPSNLVGGEDEINNSQTSRALFCSPDLAETVNRMGKNLEEPPSRRDMTGEHCDRIMTLQIVQVDCAEQFSKPDEPGKVQSDRVARYRSTSSKKYCQLEKGCNLNLPVDALSNRLGSDRVSNLGLAEFSILRPPPDDDIFVEPKQLSFDEVEYHSLSGKFAPPAEIEKGNRLVDKAEFLGPTDILMDVIGSSDLSEKHGAFILENGQHMEAVSSEEKLRATFEVHEEHRLGFFGSEKCECKQHSICSIVNLNLSATSLRSEYPEIEEVVLADMSSNGCTIPKHGTVESLEKFLISNSRSQKSGLALGVKLQERDHILEVEDNEEVQKASPKSCEKARLKFIEDGTWPQYKRRKIDGRPSNMLCTASRLPRVIPLNDIEENYIFKLQRNAVDGLETDLEFEHISSSANMKAFHSKVIRRLGEVFCQSGEHLKKQSFEPSLSVEDKELMNDLQTSGEKKDTNILEFGPTWVETSIDTSLNKEECENPQDCLSGSTCITPMLTSEDHQNFLFPGSNLNQQNKMEEMAYIGGILGDTKSVICKSLNLEDLSAAKQSMPEFERFSIDLPSEKILSLPKDRTSLGSINIQGTTGEQISFLEKLCRYTVPLTDEDLKQLEASYNFRGLESDIASCSDYMPSTGVHFDWNAGKPPCTPPVGMLGRKTVSDPSRHSFEKHWSVNPELTCFRIDEDTSTSGENENLNEVVNILHDGRSPIDISNSSSRRRPLVDTTNSKTLPSISLTTSVHDRCSIASVNTEPYMSRTQTNFKHKLRNTYGDDRRNKKDNENQSSSIGGLREASDYLHNRRPKILRKASEGKQSKLSSKGSEGGRAASSRKTSEGSRSQCFSDKGRKRANIISNVSSFIPLVRQKQQPAAIVTGKRDVKVKALEAAEAAKRLEEIRANDRRVKKEAARLERARLEEEKIKQLELNLKKKEEEQMKKEADMAGKKRLREEEDRKQREKKRKCIEEARKEQKEQDKLHAEKEEKEQRRAVDERERKKKDVLKDERKRWGPEKRSQITESRKKIKKDTRISKVATESAKTLSDIVSNIFQADHCKFSLTEGSGGPSYEISPYQVSDNEEEKEEQQDEILKQKFIPSWAREKHLQSIIPSMQQVDPCKIFPRTRMCNISEVLLALN